MFKNITTDYTGGDATVEIMIMLLGAFILGFVLRSILDKFYKDFNKIQEFNFDSEKKIEELKVEKKVIEEEDFVKREDDLKIIEGIGPKIESIFKENKIVSWEILAEQNEETLRSILKQAGDNYAFHNPKTWPAQAKLAHQGKWEELEEFQDFLNGGK